MSFTDVYIESSVFAYFAIAIIAVLCAKLFIKEDNKKKK